MEAQYVAKVSGTSMQAASPRQTNGVFPNNRRTANHPGLPWQSLSSLQICRIAASRAALSLPATYSQSWPKMLHILPGPWHQSCSDCNAQRMEAQESTHSCCDGYKLHSDSAGSGTKAAWLHITQLKLQSINAWPGFQTALAIQLNCGPICMWLQAL